jgi:hypothetical protein
MYRKNTGSRSRNSSEAKPFAAGGFAGGIFSERSDTGRPEDYLNEEDVDAVDEVFDQIEEGVRPEHLLRPDDQDALTLGRNILSVARAVGGLVRAVTSTGHVAAGDMRQHGLRGALVEGLRRAADQLDPRSASEEGLYVQEPMHWPEDPWVARDVYDPRDPHWNFRREYVRPQSPYEKRREASVERFKHGSGYTPLSTVREEPRPWQTMRDLDDALDEALDEQTFDPRAPGDDSPVTPVAEDVEDDDTFLNGELGDLDSKI